MLVQFDMKKPLKRGFLCTNRVHHLQLADYHFDLWSLWDSNPLPFDCEPNALPDELKPRNCKFTTFAKNAKPFGWENSELSPIFVTRTLPV